MSSGNDDADSSMTTTVPSEEKDYSHGLVSLHHHHHHQSHDDDAHHPRLVREVTPPEASSSKKKSKGSNSSVAENDGVSTNRRRAAPALEEDAAESSQSQRKRVKCSLFSQEEEAAADSDDVETQSVDYMPNSQTSEAQSEDYYLIDDKEKEKTMILLQNGVEMLLSSLDNKNNDSLVVYRIGRRNIAGVEPSEIHTIVGRHHADLVFNRTTHTFELQAINNHDCWILGKTKWHRLESGQASRLEFGGSFRLIPPRPNCSLRGVQFTLCQCHRAGNKILAGSGSFDYEYLKLLRQIKSNGHLQTNKKGTSWTLPEQKTLVVDLQCDEDDNKSLLPLTTLRKIYFRSNMVEALWYLRGEDSIEFLQCNRCPYWDAQADGDGFVGLNYGLLTNFPQPDGSRDNQLLTRVIDPLCQNKCSRNMVCVLSKPGEKTLQEACSSTAQFSVCAGDYLDLTVNQRSSDVILGLPNDVVAWTILLHFVRREVLRRSGRRLFAGKLYFAIASGGAHIYCINAQNWNELLERTPKPVVQPHLELKSDKGMFEIANSYDEKKNNLHWRVPGYENDRCHPRMKIEQAK